MTSFMTTTCCLQKRNAAKHALRGATLFAVTLGSRSTVEVVGQEVGAAGQVSWYAGLIQSQDHLPPLIT